MAARLPPPPHDRPPTSFEWIDWYTKVTDQINTATDHNNLSSIQGGTSGQYNHLSDAELAAVTAARDSRGTDTTDDLIVDDASKGLVLKNGSTYYRVTVNGAGALVVTNIGTTKP